MTRDELEALTLLELSNLTEDALEVLYTHFDTREHNALARLIAVAAEELWAPAEESGVEPADWPREFIAVTIDLFHDQRRAFDMHTLKEAATVIVDGMSREMRALVCCYLGTRQRARVSLLLASLAQRAIDRDLIKTLDADVAIRQAITVGVSAYMDRVDTEYFPGRN